MDKETIYFFIGIVAFQTGAFMLHYGLGIMFFGVWMLLGSYIEHDKNHNDEKKERL